ncbi:MAG: hypothetical protein IVW55_00585 [Chloroflexi bacterium]|nr:hypothetical protein [Chloroflexota bacterium]
MGLAIRAVSKVSFVSAGYAESWGHGDHISISTFNAGFSERLDGLRGGVYLIRGSELGFSAGGYADYGNWRDRLSLLMVGVPQERVWACKHRYENAPFVELIDFSDCEGAFGPATSKVLAADFARYATRIATEDSEFADLYRRFRQAFELASDTGFVLYC